MKLNKRRLEIRKPINVAKIYPLFLFYSICKNCTMLHIFYSLSLLRSFLPTPLLWYWCYSWSLTTVVNTWYQWGSYHWQDGLFPVQSYAKINFYWETSTDKTIYKLLPSSFCFKLKDAVFVIISSFLSITPLILGDYYWMIRFKLTLSSLLNRLLFQIRKEDPLWWKRWKQKVTIWVG